jgi:lysophospholipase L1-like esterase
MNFRKVLLGLTLASVCGVRSSSACPLVSGLPDANCDGKIVVTVLGDSLVAGIGDVEHSNKGGYVLRAAEHFPDATFYNLGEGGATATDLIFDLERAFSGRGHRRLLNAVTTADLIVVDVGRNDQWRFKTPLATRRNLQRVHDIIQNNLKRLTGHNTLVVTARLMIPKRLRQAPWIGELNGLLRSSNRKNAPTDLRFDTVPKRYLSEDRIHPTSQGYRKLASVFISYLTLTFPLHVRDIRPDRDHDGLYDEFESDRYGTLPTRPDTDGDRKRDGYDSDPLQRP